MLIWSPLYRWGNWSTGMLEMLLSFFYSFPTENSFISHFLNPLLTLLLALYLMSWMMSCFLSLVHLLKNHNAGWYKKKKKKEGRCSLPSFYSYVVCKLSWETSCIERAHIMFRGLEVHNFEVLKCSNLTIDKKDLKHVFMTWYRRIWMPANILEIICG